MLRTVHGPVIAIIVTVLCSGICGIRVNQEDAVANKSPYNNLDLESVQLVEPLLANKNDVVIPNEYTGVITPIVKQHNEKEDYQKDTTFGEEDIIKPRMTRQATHQYTSLYPQLPSGPPYNPYQAQPNNNLPGGQNTNQQQPSYNPYAQNPNQQQPPYNPYTQQQPTFNHSGQIPNQQQPGYNPSGYYPNQQQPSYNPHAQIPNQQQPSYNPYTQPSNQHPPSFNHSGQIPNQQQPGYNPYTQNQNQQQPGYNPYAQNSTQPFNKPAGQNLFPQRPPQWTSTNFSQPGNYNYNPNTGFSNPNQGPYNPSAGQNPYNIRPNLPSFNSSFPGNPYRPSNGQYSPNNQTFNSPPNSGNFYNPRPGQPPYNNYYPYSSGNSHPVQTFNSTNQRPPFYNPSQYPSYNNSRPNLAPWPNSSNSQYSNYPGTKNF